MKTILPLIILLSMLKESYATVWQVGPTRTYAYCSQVASLVQHGDTVEIDYAIYVNDAQVSWTKNNLLLIGVGGRPRLEAGSIIANDNVNGKGIFVIIGSNVRVENIEFANAVVFDNNGAGIRQEGANLIVHHCKFDGNEMGILQGGTIPNCTITVEFSEFVNGGSAANPGYQHNIYINHIDTFIFRYNYSHDAVSGGHELKSRANNNYILYNCIANVQTVDSRNIDLPNGGTTVVMGNIIEQGPNSENSNILGYGLEGLSNPVPHNLWITNNTFINKKTTGSFIHVASGTNTLFVKNNILAGAKTGGLIIGTATMLDSSNNIVVDNIANCGFVDAANFDYHLLSNSVAVDAGLAITATIGGYQLQADKIYKDTCNFENRTILNTLDIGAYEYNPVLSVSENAAKKYFSIYPNPSSDCVTINFSGIEQAQVIQIYNAIGILVKEVSIVDIENINIADLPNGIFFFCIKNVPLKSLKFIKKN